MISFWIVAAFMSLAITAILLTTWSRGSGKPQRGAGQDVALYRGQLAEVERDLERGVIPQAEADRVRTEISRRLLAADARSEEPGLTQTQTAPPSLALQLGLGSVLIAGTVALYLTLGAPGYGDLALQDRIDWAEDRWRNRPTQADAEGQMPAPAQSENADYQALVEKLRETVQKRPDDVQGHMLLARSEANLGNYAQAARAQATLIALKGQAATAADRLDLSEMMIFAAGGYVSPEAETVLRQILATEPMNGPARYYRGLLMTQIGRPDQAFREWDALLRAGPADASWIDPILSQIPAVAQLAGVRYDIPEIGTGRGPSAEDVLNAENMSPQARMEMIEGMVAGLSNRLATEGGTSDEWARLISALGVLRQVDQAQAVFDNARDVFADDKSALDLINRAGERAGVIVE